MEHAGKFWAEQPRQVQTVAPPENFFSEETLAELEELEQEPEEEAIFEVEEENWQAVSTFLEIAHLWRYAPMGGLLGLDWAQIIPYYGEIPFEIKKQITIIEQSAVQCLNST